MTTKILTIIGLCGAAGIPEAAIKIELRVRFSIRAGEMEFDDALQRLRAGGYARAEEDPLTDDRRWFVTSHGEARMR